MKQMLTLKRYLILLAPIKQLAEVVVWVEEPGAEVVEEEEDEDIENISSQIDHRYLKITLMMSASIKYNYHHITHSKTMAIRN